MKQLIICSIQHTIRYSIFFLAAFGYCGSAIMAQCNAWVNIPLNPCPGEIVELTATPSGGTPPYTYLWDTGGTSQTETFVTPDCHYHKSHVTVTDALGCSDVGTVFIDPVEMVCFISKSDPVCEFVGEVLIWFNGSSNVPYMDYLWSTGETTETISVNEPGLYEATVTHTIHGCTKEFSVEAEFLPKPEPEIIGPEELCRLSTGELEVTGGNFSSILWSNGSTEPTTEIQTEGLYSVTVHNSYDCPYWTDKEVGSYPITLPIIEAPLFACPNTNVPIEITNAFEFVSFEWDTDETTPNIIGLPGDEYHVTVTDFNGCPEPGVVYIEEFLVTPPTISGQDSICNGLDTTSLEIESTYQQYAWTTGQNTPTIEVSEGGNYGVTVTDINGCTSSGSYEVHADTIPIPSIDSLPISCTGDSILLEPSGGPYATYLWSTGQTDSIIYVAQTDTFAVAVTTEAGCKGDTSVVVTFHPPPTAAITTLPYTCNGSVTLQASGGAQYLWSNGMNTNSIEVISNGSYTVTVTDTSGCTNTIMETVNIPPPPQVAIDGPLSLCEDASDILTATTGYAQYNWSNGHTGEAINISASGIYAVIATDAYGCTAMAEWEVEPLLPPNVTITGPSSICSGNNATLAIVNDFIQYLWSTGETTESITVSQNGMYSLTVTDVNGCTGAGTHSLEIGGALTPFVTQTLQPCEGLANLNVSTGYENYLWSNGATGPSISVSTSGIYTVTVSDGTGCTGEEGVNVDIPVLPTVSIDGPTSVCEGTDATLTADAGFIAYQWSNGATTPQINVTQTGTCTVIATDANSCTSTDSITILPDFNTPTAEAGADQTIDCTNLQTTLDGTGSSLGSESGFQWTTQDGNIVSGETTASPIVDATGVYILTIINSENGCSSTDSVAVLPEFNTPTANAGAPPTISCVNTQATLDGMGSSQGNEFSYQWATTTGTIVSGDTTLSPVVEAVGVYILTVENMENGCTAVDSVLVEQEIVVANAKATSTNVTCNGLMNGQANATPPGGTTPFSFEWSNGDTTATIENLPPGFYDVTVYDANNCLYAGQVTIEQPPVLVVEPIAVNPAGCGGSDNGSATVAADGGTAGYSYLWSNDETTETIENLAAGNYTVTATDANNCIATLELEIITDNTIDLEQPVVITEDITVELDENGMASISVTDIDDGSYDNCGIEYMSLDATDFNCGQLGENIVTLTAMDASGNTNFAMAIVTVVDNIPPVIEGCPDNMVMPFCNSVAEFDMTAADNCSMDVSISQISGLPSGSVFPIGTTTEQVFEATDEGGNTTICSFEVTVVDSMAAMPTVADVSCFEEGDGSIAVAVTGGSPGYSYLWSTDSTGASINNLIAGIYSLSITDDMGCTLVQEYEVEEPAQLITTLVNIVNEMGSNEDGEVDVTVTGGEMPYTYQWVDINGNPIGDMEDISGLSAGTYQLFVIDADSCISSSAYTIQNVTSTNSPALDALINIFPNPTHGSLTIEFIDLPFVEMDLTVHDIISQTLFDQKKVNAATGKYLLDLEGFAEGIYLLQLNFDGEVVTKRVVKVEQ